MNGMFAISTALAAIEAKALQALATHGGPLGQQLTTSKALSVSPLYGGVVAVNVVGGSMAVLALSMKVGKVKPGRAHCSALHCALRLSELTHACPSRTRTQARKKYGVEYPTMCVPVPRLPVVVRVGARRGESSKRSSDSAAQPTH